MPNGVGSSHSQGPLGHCAIHQERGTFAERPYVVTSQLALDNHSLPHQIEHHQRFTGMGDSERELIFLLAQFDSRAGATWHCIVGRNFGSFVTHGIVTVAKYHHGNVANQVLQKRNISYTSTLVTVRYFFSKPNELVGGAVERTIFMCNIDQKRTLWCFCAGRLEGVIVF